MKNRLTFLALFGIFNFVVSSAFCQSKFVEYVETIADFETLGSENEVVIYDGSIWMRESGAISSSTIGYGYIIVSGDDYHEVLPKSVPVKD